MLDKEEKAFIEYWEQNRLRRKKVMQQLFLGLPLAAILVAAIFINFFSGWYKRADMEIRSEQSSLVLILLIAALLIVVFVVIFSVRHKWEMHEQRYLELLSRENREPGPGVDQAG